ncbi:MAG: RnfABCDGE type electron transport complex subunit G [Flavobacteriales bacterium]|nr:RnfABCDGE type electron transport complex subunit G [Flavobacteriia bacterium]NCP05866.1 RnfABCDGE type electron transport complex subunit G [Flavobacteriales bacterium]PIV93214.1 MAG: RnfABCDGE type electron transport complex subunit G [Flavobacteriaceae bacterium CG17_big_fil_post_rev_8_21_14_2_50_33_15]PIY12844.1 MAG: RnfABCDGE type electron transport complex subunit G [Flavobacteriaceae bacterium CG_4_10_14_3_um_filter_33_47]PJB19995.1 MAG: RnfABCDGE type electron transport complex subun
MSKKESTFFGMLLSLLVITLVSGFALGFVNDLTIEPKAKAKLEKKINALKLVLPAFDNNPVEDVKMVTSDKVSDSVEIYPAYSKNEFVGAAVIGSTDKGFSGLVKLMIGFKPNGDIVNIVVLEQKETPGLGTKMTEDKFIKQFKGVNISDFKLQVKKDGGDVDALTGATISSRAFCDVTQIAYDAFIKNNNSLSELKH